MKSAALARKANICDADIDEDIQSLELQKTLQKTQTDQMKGGDLQQLTWYGPTHLLATGVNGHSVDPTVFNRRNVLIAAPIRVGFVHVKCGYEEHQPVTYTHITLNRLIFDD